jgi:histone H3
MARTKSVPTKQPAHQALLAKKSSKKKTAVPEIGGVKAKAPRRFKPGTVAVRDIRKAQRHGNRGIPKSVIDGLVREIATNFTEGNKDIRFKKSALRALHEATESFQTDVMRLAGTLSLHAKRKTLDVASLKLASTLVLCPQVFHETQGTSKAMKGCLGNRTKILWDAPAYPKDADDDKAAKMDADRAAKKATKKAAKAADAQIKADEAAEPADEAAEPAAAAAVDTGVPADTEDEGCTSADEA